jgi:hypothetical protein
LTRSFIVALILYDFNPESEIIVKTDEVNLVIARVPSHYANNGMLHLVTDFPRKHFRVEINHEIHDRELLAIVHAFNECCPPLHGTPQTIELILD